MRSRKMLKCFQCILKTYCFMLFFCLLFPFCFQTVNIADAYLDHRFDPSVDDGTGFKHNTILCMAIKNSEGRIIGVIQVRPQIPLKTFVGTCHKYFWNQLYNYLFGYLSRKGQKSVCRVIIKSNVFLINLNINIFISIAYINRLPLQFVAWRYIDT